MEIAVYLLVAAFLLLLNAFFVLAEFAAVKMRPTRIQELSDAGHPRSELIQHIHEHLDEYLSVCQVGITFASIGLGFVGEPAFARILGPVFGEKAHAAAIAVAYILVSFLHIWLGEQVPKMVGIYRAEGAMMFVAIPLRIFRFIFYLPLQALKGVTNLVLRLFGIRPGARESLHSEEELRIILARSQTLGLMSFRRLLLLENIFDVGDLKVRDAMRLRDGVKTLKLGAPWEENLKTIRETRFSRYPLLDGRSPKPLGIIHVKDLLYEGPERMAQADLKKMARPYYSTSEDTPLESLLAELQRRRGHLAIVLDRKGGWTGVISLEDIIEEIVGTIEDEYEVEPPLFLADALNPGRVVLGIEAATLEEGIEQAVRKVPGGDLPFPAEKIVRAVIEREKAMSTYLGRGLAIPHARLDGMDKAVLIFVRSDAGIPVRGREEKAHLLFILLTPSGSPRIQARLLARIGGLMESDYVETRLRDTATAQGVVEAIRAAEAVSLG